MTVAEAAFEAHLVGVGARPKPKTTANELAGFLIEAGAKVTFDSERDIHKPCFNCGQSAAPRTLHVVGTWTGPVGNRGGPGTPIRRPLCAACAPKDNETKGDA